MESYIPANIQYDEAPKLAAYLGEIDVDLIHSTLECHQALREGEIASKIQAEKRKKSRI